MANMMEKIGEKLHMGGHKKEEPQPHIATTAAPAGYGGSALNDPHHTAGVPPAGVPHKEGAMGKMKNKVKAKAHGEDSSSSSSSSESDGEGGRRKRVGMKKKVGML